jgi:hypothetical protein
MLVSIPWDVWAAAALAAAVALLGIFGPTLAILSRSTSPCARGSSSKFFSVKSAGAASAPRREPHSKRGSGSRMLFERIHSVAVKPSRTARATFCRTRQCPLYPNSDRKSGPPRKAMSALPLKADKCGALGHVSFGPIRDIGALRRISIIRSAKIGKFRRVAQSQPNQLQQE